MNAGSEALLYNTIYTQILEVPRNYHLDNFVR
jgi:hypothetical protein